MRRSLFLAWLPLTLFGLPARADQVTLKNGDRLTAAVHWIALDVWPQNLLTT